MGEQARAHTQHRSDDRAPQLSRAGAGLRWVSGRVGSLVGSVGGSAGDPPGRPPVNTWGSQRVMAQAATAASAPAHSQVIG